MNSNILISEADQNTRDLFAVTFELYKIAELNKNLYRKDQDVTIPKRLIELYYSEIKPDYNSMFYNFRKKYIANESLVEKNNTKLEKSGIGLVYDYIQNFNPEKDYFNIFTTGLLIHQLLYKPLDDARKENQDESFLKATQMLKTAKEEKSLQKFHEARKLMKELDQTLYNFGGCLRNDDVYFKDTEINVPSAKDAKDYFNSFVSKEKIVEYQNVTAGADIFLYIDYCINITTNLIKNQPFNDGNKRTFRSLLNLMFKNRNLPPVYVTAHERKEYKEALFKAIKTEDYHDLENFYYFKICDSIYELDVKPYLNTIKEMKDNNQDRKVKII